MEDQGEYKKRDAELEREILLGIFGDQHIETRFLANELGLTAGDLRKWLCSMGLLLWTYGQGYSVHESFKSWGYEKSKYNPKTQKYDYYIYWLIKGRIEIHKMYRRWLSDGNRPVDIKQMKR